MNCPFSQSFFSPAAEQMRLARINPGGLLQLLLTVFGVHFSMIGRNNVI
jgi:hypothetical protein